MTGGYSGRLLPTGPKRVANFIVLDTSVLISYLYGGDPVHARAQDLLAHEVDDDFAADTVTLAEVVVVPARQGRLDELRTVLADLGIEGVDLPRRQSANLARLRASTGIEDAGLWRPPRRSS